jgi:predicted DNA-binding transcriptional regulator YafY
VRADRLVAVLLLLQAKGRVTAAEVAEELEVSERTARRDLEALGLAGLPVYSMRGRNGGWYLAGDGRTDLSGLSAAEARALFLVAGPSSSATPEVRAALRKLVRALPEPFRREAQAAWSAVVVDDRSWDGSSYTTSTPQHLDAVQHAVVLRRQIELGYAARDGACSTRVVHPLGLATKRSVWYLVADTVAGLRTFRVDRMTAVRVLDDDAVRPPDFDLEQAWGLITDRVDELRSPVVARGVARADHLDVLRMVFGSRLRIASSPREDSVDVEVRGQSEISLAGELAGLGAGIEVVDPPAIREHLARIGRALVEQYVPS